jgi:hypothetical protein
MSHRLKLSNKFDNWPIYGTADLKYAAEDKTNTIVDSLEN